MLPSSGINDKDPHGNEITDICSFGMSGQDVVLTGCKDSKMRAYIISPGDTDKKLTK